MNISDIKYPETPEEVTANRKRYIKALRRYKNQCLGDLYRNGPGGKELKCAIGVAGAEFFGIKTRAQYMKVLKQEDYEWNLYDATAKMLGIPNELYGESYQSDEIDISALWKMNDNAAMKFPEIAERLEGSWGVK